MASLLLDYYLPGCIYGLQHPGKYNPKKEAKKEEKEELKKAKESSAVNSEDLSSGQEENIKEVWDDDPIAGGQLLKKASRSNELVQYTYYYLTNPEAKLIKLSKIEKEFVNGVAKIAGYDKIYDSVASLDLALFDTKSNKYQQNSRFFVSLPEIIDYTSSNYFKELADAKNKVEEEINNPNCKVIQLPIGEFKPSFMEEMGDDDLATVKPIQFNNDILSQVSLNEDKPIVNKQPAGMSDETFKYLEENIAPNINGRVYRYSIYQNCLLPHIFVKVDDTSREWELVLDPGLIIGGEAYVLANMLNDTIFVKVDSDLGRKVLNDPYYILNENDVQLARTDLFLNDALYCYFDMSGETGRKITTLPKEDFQKLGKKLTFIMNKILEQGVEQNALPRFRFSKMESINDFEVVSDRKVLNPLAELGYNFNIIDGLVFKVDGDNVSCTLNGVASNYTIESYGQM